MANKLKIKDIKTCRLCGKQSLKEIIDFGDMSLPTWPQQKGRGIKAPLKFMACPSCCLGQLAHSIDRENLFRDYWYRTGINNTMRSHMIELAKSISQEVKLGNKDLVVDVGANDGTLLYNYKKGNLVGFEPSNLCPSEKETGIKWINDFFSPKLLPKKAKGSVVALTTIAMFYYFDDPIAVARSIKSLLAKRGIWVCEMTYAIDMIRNLSFDFINHEHVTVWSASQFDKVVKKVGLELFRIEKNSLNGGSIRLWAGMPSFRKVEKSVEKTLLEEKKYTNMESWYKFAKRVRETSNDLEDIIKNLHHKGKEIMVYGASTRGLTILGAANLDSKAITAAVEKNTEKVGRYYGATEIPVISEEKMRSNQPDALLILPYSFISEFVKREREYLEKGVFVVPVPKPKIITKSTKEANV